MVFISDMTGTADLLSDSPRASISAYAFNLNAGCEITLPHLVRNLSLPFKPVYVPSELSIFEANQPVPLH